MEGVVLLEHAHDVSLFGSKAIGLGDAARSGLPLPPGVALSGDVVEAVAGGEKQAIEDVAELVRPLEGDRAGGRGAVRPSSPARRRALGRRRRSRRRRREAGDRGRGGARTAARRRSGWGTRRGQAFLSRPASRSRATSSKPSPAARSRRSRTWRSSYGRSTAIGLGDAARSGLPLPPGVALSGDVVEAVAGGEKQAIEDVAELVRPLDG